MKVDTVVVGAGLSGLVRAMRLQRAGVNVVVLEARDRVGGRTLNVPIGPGKVVELGGQWAGPRHREILRVAGSMDGAISAGERAAREVLAELPARVG
jgi:monoamine oxidase